MKKLSVVIPTYNPNKNLGNLISELESIKDKKKNDELYLVIVDNSSESKTIDKLVKKYKDSKWVKILKNKSNLGFARAVNIGIRQALKEKLDSVLILNQDVKANSDFLTPLLSNKAYIVAPVISFHRNKGLIYDHGGKVNWLTGRTYHIETRSKDQRLVTNDQIDYVSGCCMLVRSDVFKKIGFFDEKFFMYFEDVDFCLRAKKQDLVISVEEKAFIYHDLEEGSKRSFTKKLYHLKSNLIFINKHLGLYKVTGFIYILFLFLKIFMDQILSHISKDV